MVTYNYYLVHRQFEKLYRYHVVYKLIPGKVKEGTNDNSVEIGRGKIWQDENLIRQVWNRIEVIQRQVSFGIEGHCRKVVRENSSRDTKSDEVGYGHVKERIERH